MDSAQHAPIWHLPVRSLSPLDLASQVDARTAVRVVVGSADHVTPPAFSRPYVQRLTARGIRADLVELKGAGHDILLDPRVLREITSVLGAPPTS
jgi:alpha-beta hydrolase superfamily lysophospholipase